MPSNDKSYPGAPTEWVRYPTEDADGKRIWRCYLKGRPDNRTHDEVVAELREDHAGWPHIATSETSRLLSAAYDAMESSADAVGVDAVTLAERLREGGVAKLLAAVERGAFLLERIVEGDHHALHNAEQAAKAMRELTTTVRAQVSDDEPTVDDNGPAF